MARIISLISALLLLPGFIELCKKAYDIFKPLIEDAATSVGKAYEYGKNFLASFGIYSGNLASLLTGIPDSGKKDEKVSVRLNPFAVDFFESVRPTDVNVRRSLVADTNKYKNYSYALAEGGDGGPLLIKPGGSGTNQASPGFLLQNDNVTETLTEQSGVKKDVLPLDSTDRANGIMIFVVIATLIGFIFLYRALPSEYKFLDPIFKKLGIFQSWWDEFLSDVQFTKHKLYDRSEDSATLRNLKVELLEELLGLKGYVRGYPKSLVVLKILDEVSLSDIQEYYQDKARVDVSYEVSRFLN